MEDISFRIFYGDPNIPIRIRDAKRVKTCDCANVELKKAIENSELFDELFDEEITSCTKSDYDISVNYAGTACELYPDVSLIHIDKVKVIDYHEDTTRDTKQRLALHAEQLTALDIEYIKKKLSNYSRTAFGFVPDDMYSLDFDIPVHHYPLLLEMVYSHMGHLKENTKKEKFHDSQQQVDVLKECERHISQYLQLL
jgi:hypothetical protein